MTKRTYRASVACAIAAALLTGCGGGGSGSTPVTPSVPGGSRTANVSMTFHFNNQTSQSALRGRKYTSRATHGVSVSWEQSTQDGVAHFATAPSVAQAMRTGSTFVAAITPATVTNNITCGAADASGAFSCTVLMPVTTGYTDFRIATWDQAPATLGANNDGFGGTFANSANDLSTNVLMTYRINANQTNAFNFTTNGVVRSVALAVNPNSLVSGGNAQTASLSVLAKDADGNIIIGNDPYVDDNGSPVTITVNRGAEVYPVPLVGPAAPANGNVTFVASPNCATAIQCTITDPTVQSLTISYDAYETTSSAFTVSAASTGTAISTVGTVLAFTNSTDGPVNVPGSPTMTNLVTSGKSYDITAGNNGDNSLYSSDYTDNQIVQYTPAFSSALTVARTWNIPTANAFPRHLVQGADQNIYFSEYFGNNVGVLNGATNQFQETPGICNPDGIAAGSDRNIYVLATGTAGCGANIPQAIVEVEVASPNAQTFGQPGAYPILASHALSAQPTSIVSGASGNLYVTEPNAIAVATPGLTSVTEHNVPGALAMFGSAFGTDGNLYATDEAAHKIYQIAVSGPNAWTVTNSWTTSGSPIGITLARDGNLYFTEDGGGSAGAPNFVGRLTPGAPSQPAEFSSGVVTGSSSPYGIVQGADNDIYFTYYTDAHVAYFAP